MSVYIPVALRRQVRLDAKGRCGYCLSSEAVIGIVLEIEHIHPTSLGGKTVRQNLWLACHRCNQCKNNRIRAVDLLTQEEVALFNPRTQYWQEHFRWDHNGIQILGLTAAGRATVVTLQMNDEYVTQSRRFWVILGIHPPVD